MGGKDLIVSMSFWVTFKGIERRERDEERERARAREARGRESKLLKGNHVPYPVQVVNCRDFSPSYLEEIWKPVWKGKMPKYTT